MINSVGTLLMRSKDIFQTEGFAVLLRRFFRHFIYEKGNYYLCETAPDRLHESDFMPRIENHTCRIVSTNSDADELAEITGFDFRLHFLNARRSLAKGATATCVFIDNEIAHIGWVAFDKEAQKAISPIPIEVHFHHLKAFAGNGLTTPEYRGRGLLGLGSFMRMQLTRDNGFNSLVFAIETKNTAAQRGLAKLSPRIYAKGRYIRVLWWKHWKETPCSYVDKENPQVPSMIP